MFQAIEISATAARRFLVGAFGLRRPHALPDVAAALDLLEFIQMDSINVCGRIHDLILWSRVPGYHPSGLDTLLYGQPRQAFEYYFPNLSVLPLRDYPYFACAMKARAQTPGRWQGLLPDEVPIAERLLSRMKDEGPLRTRASGAQDGYTTSGWGTRTTVAAQVIEKLWLHGQLTVAQRSNFERSFDLTERVFPEAARYHSDDAVLPGEADERVYKIRKRLRARRLFRPRADEVRTLGPEAFVPVRLANTPRLWYVLAEDAPVLAQAESLAVENDVNLLAPLDPLIYDRERTRNVFDFDYTWEVYTPVAKRRWGYYVLPVLWGDRLAGRVDPKIDRKTKILTLVSLQLEPWVDARQIVPALASRLVAFARFLGAERIVLARVEPPETRACLQMALADALEKEQDKQ